MKKIETHYKRTIDTTSKRKVQVKQKCTLDKIKWKKSATPKTCTNELAKLQVLYKKKIPIKEED